MRMSDKRKTLETFEKAIKFFPRDLQLKIQYCTYLETFKVEQAFKVYQKIWPELQQREDLLGCELLNNLAIVYTDQGEYQEAS